MRLAILLAVLLVCPLAVFSQANTWYVDDDAPNDPGPNDPSISDPMEDGSSSHPFDMIQEAINVASSADMVLVLPGLYREQIDFFGKYITVSGKWGPEVTRIDGGGLGSVAMFHTNENKDSILEGFTIINGAGTVLGTKTYGGAIFCDHASPTIRHNVIIKNEAMFGGGIFCGPEIKPVIVSNTISLNHAYTAGGSGGKGGGLYFEKKCKPLILNNVLFSNMAGDRGGGIHCNDSDLIMTNNSICLNSATNVGGGLSNNLDVQPHESTICNTIFWNNDSQTGNDIYNTGVLNISYSDIPGTVPPYVLNMGGGFINWGLGIINVDPDFVDLNAGDLHLLFSSPCMNSGLDTATALPMYDYEGDPRIVVEVDIGADEVYRHLYYTGHACPGGSVEIKIAGNPGTTPVALFMNNIIYEPPIGIWGGKWFLGFSFVGPIFLGAIPANGVLILPGTLPMLPMGPYDLYFQSAQDGPPELSNLCIMHVN